jgi:hypothetical protein
VVTCSLGNQGYADCVDLSAAENASKKEARASVFDSITDYALGMKSGYRFSGWIMSSQIDGQSSIQRG